MRAEVYVNLHTGTFSVRSLEKDEYGRVVMHPPSLYIKNAAFVVRKGGQRRARREKRRNVHAFVRGEFRRRGPSKKWKQVFYNPFRDKTFVDAKGNPVTDAAWVKLKGQKAYIPDE